MAAPIEMERRRRYDRRVEHRGHGRPDGAVAPGINGRSASYSEAEQA